MKYWSYLIVIWSRSREWSPWVKYRFTLNGMDYIVISITQTVRKMTLWLVINFIQTNKNDKNQRCTILYLCFFINDRLTNRNIKNTHSNEWAFFNKNEVDLQCGMKQAESVSGIFSPANLWREEIRMQICFAHAHSFCMLHKEIQSSKQNTRRAV